MAAVRRRGNRWWYSYTDPVSGRRERGSFGPLIRTEAQAKARLRQIEQELGAGASPAGFEPIEVVVEAFLSDKAERREPLTVIAYRKHLRSFLRRVPGATPIDEIAPERVAAYLRARVEEDGIAKATANKELVTLRVLWTWAGKRGMATRNPATAVEPYSVRPGRRTPPPEALVDEAISHLRGLAAQPTRAWSRGGVDRVRGTRGDEAEAAALYADLLEFVAWTALRFGEVCAIEPADVDLAAETVRTRSARNKGPRVVPLVGPALEIVRRRLAAREALAESGEGPAERLFLTSGGRPAAHALNDFGKGWRDAHPQFAAVVPHGIRHLVSDRLRRAKVHPIVAARLLGHATIQMHAHYSHEEISETRDALRRLAGDGRSGSGRRRGARPR